jgi:uncharacterized protein YdiU (UPF0061 family)
MKLNYSQLPSEFYSEATPLKFEKAKLVFWNEGVASKFPSGFSSNEFLSMARGENSWLKEPIAMAYAGHQFGHFNVLGDGRAALVDEWKNKEGILFDLHLKGSGETLYSRRGDGRATLKAMLREAIMSEAIHALGIRTTRTLAVVDTGDFIHRNGMEKGGLLARMASSHLRVGTFEYSLVQDDVKKLKALADYTIARHYPQCASFENPYLELLKEVASVQIALIVEWMRVGFIHGVMNTDNMSIAGETIDYGPCAFMNVYKSSTCFSSIDTQGRYAFANQPGIAQWNLWVFANSLLPLIHEKAEVAKEMAIEVIDAFPENFGKSYYAMMGRKLGVEISSQEGREWVEEFLEIMQETQSDYTNSFLFLEGKEVSEVHLSSSSRFEHWLSRKDNFSKVEIGNSNPIVIPRNEWVERVLNEAVENDNWKLFSEYQERLQRPYESQLVEDVFSTFNPKSDLSFKTFCGT